MFGSAIVYLGLIISAAGLVLAVKPIRRLRVTTRRRGLGVAGAGVLLISVGLILPASESRVTRIETHLDEFAPVWQFREFHTIEVAAPPARVFEAIKRVRPDEILLFRTLIAIRGGGQPPPRSVQNAAGEYQSLIDIATHSTFVVLADDAPREFVNGTVVGAPPGPREPLTPEVFQKPQPPGFALATMNFCDGGRLGRLDRFDRDTRVCQQSLRPTTVCRLLAGHLPRQRTHSPDVAARHPATRDQSGWTLIRC